MPLESIAQNVWVSPWPHVFGGLHIGCRMSVVRLTDGSLFVFSPIQIDDELKNDIDALGPVAHIVAPSLFHHVYFGDFAAAYPDARTYGAAGLEKKRKDLSFDAELTEEGWPDELTAIAVPGTALGETEFFHHPSRTLITADLIQNFDSSDHWPTRMYLKVAGIHKRINTSRPIRFMYRDKREARKSIDRLIELGPERITLAHGNPILSDGTEALRGAYQWLGG